MNTDKIGNINIDIVKELIQKWIGNKNHLHVISVGHVVQKPKENDP